MISLIPPPFSFFPLTFCRYSAYFIAVIRYATAPDAGTFEKGVNIMADKSSGKKSSFLGTLFRTAIIMGILMVAIIKLPEILTYLQTSRKEAAPRREKVPVPAPIDWTSVDAAVAEILKTARRQAERSAESRLTDWTDTMLERVDNDFLSWYFDYWNQQVLGLKSLWYWSLNKLIDDQPTAAEQITEDVQLEFANRVIRPQIAQLELENITRDIMERYVYEIRNGLNRIPDEYRIPRGEWERYLADIAVVTTQVEGSRRIDLSLKALIVGGASGVVMFSGPLRAATSRFGSRLAPKFAGKTAAKMATITGKKVARKTGGRFLGPIIAIGIMIWDYWDHEQTKEANKPLLRNAIDDYFQEMRGMLMYDSEAGIMSVIHDIELTMIESIE